MDGDRPVGAAQKIAFVTTVALSVRLLLADQIRFLGCRGFDVTAISGGGADAEAVSAAGIRQIFVPFTRRMNLLADLRATFHLWRVCRHERFAIVHTHQPKPGLFGQLAARLAGVPIVVNTVHGFLFTERSAPRSRRFWILLERLAARWSDKVLCVSGEDARTAVRERICRPDSVVHIGGGIDVDRFSRDAIEPARLAATRAGLGIPAGHRVVGFVGRLVAEKGIPELLDAFRAVHRELPDTVLLIIGPGDPDKRDAMTPDAIAAAHPDLPVQFAGYRHDMPYLYALMDVFVLPSHREGLPQTLMEAAAMGIPAVATDVRGCREVVVDGQTGLIVPPGDATSLAAALIRILRSPAETAAMGRQAVARARREYDQRRVFDRLDALYRELLDARGANDSQWAKTASES